MTIGGQKFTLRCLTEKHIPAFCRMVEPFDWGVTLGDVQRLLAHNEGQMFGLFDKEDVMLSE